MGYQNTVNDTAINNEKKDHFPKMSKLYTEKTMNNEDSVRKLWDRIRGNLQ